MEFRNVLVVYDPTRSEQPAMDRAALIAATVPARITVFACIHAEQDGKPIAGEGIRRRIEEQKQVLEAAVAPLVERGARVHTEVEWDRDWYSAVVRAAIRHGADVVLKSTYRHTARQRILNRTSDWTLIRECQCPVLLVREGEQRDMHKVLAAIDIRARDESYGRLNRQIIDFGRRVLDSRRAEVHFINAFRELGEFPDRNELIRNCGVDSSRIHIQIGEPDEVIVDRARELDASLVVVGNSARSGFSAAINGNTVEKVLDRLECDLLSLP
jgi:universal stress protein E